jgi:hypothetical protein
MLFVSLVAVGCGNPRMDEREVIEVTLAPSLPSITAGARVPFTATVRFSDDTTEDVTAQVVWTSSTTAVASMHDGVATGLAAGTSTISATLSGTTATTTLTVTAAVLASIGVTPIDPVMPDGTSRPFTATGTYSDGRVQDLTSEVTWTATTGATVSNAPDSPGLVTAQAASGTATITATDPATGIFGAATVTLDAAVLVSIVVDPSNQSLPRSTTESYVATGVYSDFTTQDLTAAVTWSSSNTVVATVSDVVGSEGMVDTLTPGTTAIRALDPATGIAGEATLVVNNTMLASITVTPLDPTIAKGARLQFVATGHYQDGSARNLTQFVSWSSSAPNLASVSNASKRRGVATGKNAGTVTITATDPATLIYGSMALSVSTATLESLTLTPSVATIPGKTREYFTATGNFSDGSSSDLTAAVSWSSSDETIATISNQPFHHGIAAGVSPGTVTITAVDAATALAATATLTVSSATLVSIAVAPAAPSIIEGTILPLTATGTFSDGSTRDLTREVTWVSGNTAIATVLNIGITKGTVTGIAVGTTSMTANYPQTMISGSATVTIVP